MQGVEYTQACMRTVLAHIPALDEARGRADPAKMRALEQVELRRADGTPARLQIITVDRFVRAFEAQLRRADVYGLVERRRAAGRRTVFVTEGMLLAGEKKSADWLTAHVFARLGGDAGVGDAMALLDVGKGAPFEAMRDALLFGARGRSPGERLPVVLLNDGAFTGNQQTAELELLGRLARHTGVPLDVITVVPFCTAKALRRFEETSAAYGPLLSVQPLDTTLFDGPFPEFDGADTLAFFEHKGAPDPPAFPAEHMGLYAAANAAAGKPVYKKETPWRACAVELEHLLAVAKGVAGVAPPPQVPVATTQREMLGAA